MLSKRCNYCVDNGKLGGADGTGGRPGRRKHVNSEEERVVTAGVSDQRHGANKSDKKKGEEKEVKK